MDGVGIYAILAAFASLDESDVLDINLLLIAINLRKLDYINEDFFKKCVRIYIVRPGIHRNTRQTVLNLFSFLKDIVEIVSFEKFVQCLRNAGYFALYKRVLLKREMLPISKAPLRRLLPNEKTVRKFYTNCKTMIDENIFKDGKVGQLRRMICEVDGKLASCDSSNFSRRQIQSDKRVILYFLLCQQYFEPNKRVTILKNLRDKTPHDIDRTYLDIVFHLYKTLDLAIAGDIATSNAHERTARMMCSLCRSPFASLIMNLWGQYKHDVLFLSNRGYPDHQLSHLKSANEGYLQVMNITSGLSEEETDLWRTISSSEMVMALLEINWYSTMPKLKEVNRDNIVRARDILDKMNEPKTIRRKMYYFLCQGRLEEGTNTEKACEFVRKALTLVDAGINYKQEQIEMENYLKTLEHSNLPKPNIV